MSFEHKENYGSMFVNKEKKKPNHADRTGTINVAGKVYYINGWIKQDKNGNPYLSLAVKPVEQKPDSAGKRDGGVSQMDDDIPFAPIGRGISGHSI